MKQYICPLLQNYQTRLDKLLASVVGTEKVLWPYDGATAEM